MALCIDLQYITTFGLSSLDKNKVKRKQFSIEKGTWAKMIVKIHGSILLEFALFFNMASVFFFLGCCIFLLLLDKFTVNPGFRPCILLAQNNLLQ